MMEFIVVVIGIVLMFMIPVFNFEKEGECK